MCVYLIMLIVYFILHCVYLVLPAYCERPLPARHPYHDVTAGEDKEVVDGDMLARMSIRSGTRIRPAQDVSEVKGGVGGEKGWAEDGGDG
jgi:hypothetical protein